MSVQHGLRVFTRDTEYVSILLHPINCSKRVILADIICHLSTGEVIYVRSVGVHSDTPCQLLFSPPVQPW